MIAGNETTSAPESREFGPGFGKLRNGFVIAALIVAIGLWALFLAGDSLPDGETVGGALVAGGLVFGLWTWKTFRSGRTLLRLSPEGVWFRPWGGATIPWHAVSSIYARGGRLRRFICIELADSGALLSALPAEERKELERSTLTRLPVLFIPYGAVEAPPAELGELLQDYLAASR
jgi:hypothetical protein